MAYGRFSSEQNVEYVYTDASRSPSKMLSRSFLYMAIGLVITGVVGFLVALGFAYWLTGARFDANNRLTSVGITYIAIMIGTFIALIIDTVVINATLAKGKHSLIVPFVIYSVLMGVLLSSFVLIIDFWTIAEALGISAAVFLILFFIGYFSKKDLSPFAFIGLSILMMLGFLGLFWGLFYFLNPQAFLVYNIIFSFAFGIVMLIVIAADAYNIKKILANGQENNNLALYCAWVMYSDFIILFIRILYILILIKGKE